MGGGSETASNEFKPPEWTRDLYPQAMNAAVGLAQRPYQQFYGMRVAPMSDRSNTAGELITDRALFGDPQSNAARGSLMNISQGGAQNPFVNSANPWIGQTNPYLNNQYLNADIANTASDMAAAHATGTAATNNMLAAQAGAFGGSGHIEKQAADAAALAKQVGNMATGARSADLGRQTSAAATDLGRNTDAWAQDIGRRGGLYQADVGNVMQASSMAPAFANMDHQDFNALNNFGQQQQNYTQSLLNEQVNEFNRQQNFPLQNLDLLFSALAKGSGQYGTNFAQGPGQSGAMNAIGGGLGLLGMFGGM